MQEDLRFNICTSSGKLNSKLLLYCHPVASKKKNISETRLAQERIHPSQKNKATHIFFLKKRDIAKKNCISV